MKLYDFRMITCAVAGASGYAGGEIVRLLSNHPEATIGALAAGSSAGQRVGTVHPHLAPVADRLFDDTSAEVLAGHDVVFLALPHGQSAALAAALPDDVVVIDCGADFRLADEDAWATFYDTDFVGTWPYGMPELLTSSGKQRADLSGARRIAVPGCYPTAVSLALAPAFAAGLVEPDDVVIVAASGTSGAGKSLKPHLLGAEVMGSMSPYGVGGVHRHTPEIEQNLSRAAGVPVTISFTPSLAPMPRGILATSTARLADGATTDVVRSAYEEAYGTEKFVQVMPVGDWPSTGAVLGSNNVQIQFAIDEHAGRLIVTSAVDNLTKGTAGAAVQCMNLALGIEESSGLPTVGVAP